MIELYKVSDTNSRLYFGFKIQKDSNEMHIIKNCNGRKWHPIAKLWLLPYNKDNWNEVISKIPVSNIINTQKSLTVSDPYFTPIQKKEAPKKTLKPIIILSEKQQMALLLLKEQLLINRYQLNTHKTYLCCFTEFLSYYPHKEPTEISKEDIKEFLLYKIKTDNISESTQNSLINAIKFYYEKVEKRERFVIYDLRPRKAHKLPGFLSKEEVIKLINVIENDKHKLIIKLIYSAGLRIGELVRLKIREIKWDSNQILIKCSKGKKDRLVTLSEKIKDDITAYLEKYKPNYYLIEGQEGGAYSPRSIQNIFQNAIVKAKIETHATVHTLRHSYATHMILNGADIRVIQELLGHSSIKTTEIYTHITDSIKKEIKSPLDSLDL